MFLNLNLNASHSYNSWLQGVWLTLPISTFGVVQFGWASSPFFGFGFNTLNQLNINLAKADISLAQLGFESF